MLYNLGFPINYGPLYGMMLNIVSCMWYTNLQRQFQSESILSVTNAPWKFYSHLKGQRHYSRFGEKKKTIICFISHLKFFLREKWKYNLLATKWISYRIQIFKQKWWIESEHHVSLISSRGRMAGRGKQRKASQQKLWVASTEAM